jgi:hypothetical protein
LTRIAEVTLIELPCHRGAGGDLVAMEGLNHLPFSIARVFTVNAPAGNSRGNHAHKACTQFLVCPTGCVEVVCDDGTDRVVFILDRPNVGLLVPPSIWARQTYRAPGSVLLVICDRPYEEDDYIRDYTTFLGIRLGNGRRCS